MSMQCSDHGIIALFHPSRYQNEICPGHLQVHSGTSTHAENPVPGQTIVVNLVQVNRLNDPWICFEAMPSQFCLYLHRSFRDESSGERF